MDLNTFAARSLQKSLMVVFVVWFSVLSPAVVFAQEAVDALGNPTGAPAATGTPVEETGAPVCTGAGCGQGANQGMGQGSGNGGPSLADLGGYIDESGQEVLPEGVVDTRQGAAQGTAQGASQGSGTALSGTNTGTGAGSSNAVDAGVNNAATTSINNTAANTTNVDAAANTGANTNNKNTGAATAVTGNAGIGVTQLVNDNTATINGNVGLGVSGYQGDYSGDLVLDFNNALSLLSGSSNTPLSLRAINDTTGSDSTNDVNLNTTYEELNEVQNDGNINNQLDLLAVTGQNEASMNTGNGSIFTGNANIAATLVNLLNTTVINGNLAIAVQDIFGDLMGNIILPNLSQLASSLWGGGTQINASNDTTGSDSTNAIDIDITEKEKTAITNEADINTTVNANAITGQNDTLANTGGGRIDTGNASVTASSVSVANTTVEGGNWGLVIVNALNRWLGFLVGDSGEVRALSQAETIREIEARNTGTGADSQNNISIDDLTERTTTVDNNATINNQINATAITGQNDASMNTGQGSISTGNANILATAVNLANTTVKNANLGIAVVNIFGNWLGDLIYGGSSLTAAANTPTNVDVQTNNANTGSDSSNTIDINYDRTQETNIDNQANIATVLNANIDTGTNRANRNTTGAAIETGQAYLGLHSRAIANVTGISLDNNGLAFNIEGGNNTTGFDSTNKIVANVNDQRIINIDNDANVSTIFPAQVNTGNNEANQNTIGGDIDTGKIKANVGIHNLVNRLILAFGDDIALAGNGGSAGLTIGADLINALTGAKSNNENLVDAVRELLVGVLDNAVINNIVDFLFNTGGNQSNQNTLAMAQASVEEQAEEGVTLANNPTTSNNDTTGEQTNNAAPAAASVNNAGNGSDQGTGGGSTGDTENSVTTTSSAGSADTNYAAVASWQQQAPGSPVAGVPDNILVSQESVAGPVVADENFPEAAQNEPAPLALANLAGSFSDNSSTGYMFWLAVIAGLTALAGVIAFFGKRRLAYSD